MEKVGLRKGDGNVFVVVDGQNDFVWEKGALYVAGTEGEAGNEVIINRIRSLAYREAFDMLVTTEDEHPLGHVEFAVFGAHCVKGTTGQRYAPELLGVYGRADENLKKDQNVFTYSVAMSPQFVPHIIRLREAGIKRVFVAGWAYNFCVGESAIAYAGQGFETFVVRDCTRSVPGVTSTPEKMDRKLSLYGVKEIFSEDIVYDACLLKG